MVVLGLRMYQKKVLKKKSWGTCFFRDLSKPALTARGPKLWNCIFQAFRMIWWLKSHNKPCRIITLGGVGQGFVTLSHTSIGIFAIYRYFGARKILKLADNHISAVKQVSGHIEYIKPYRIITLGGVGQGFMTVSQASFKIFAILQFFSACESLKLKENQFAIYQFYKWFYNPKTTLKPHLNILITGHHIKWGR